MSRRKPTKEFRKWWKKHRKHLMLADLRTGVVYCGKCLVVPPRPYRKDR